MRVIYGVMCTALLMLPAPLAAIDRVCFRLPDKLSTLLGSSRGKGKRHGLQRHLAPHLDCCPPHVQWRAGGVLYPQAPSGDQYGVCGLSGRSRAQSRWF